MRRYQVGLLIKSFGHLKELLDDGRGLRIRFEETEQPEFPEQRGAKGVIGVVHIRSNVSSVTERARVSVESIIATIRIRHAKDDR